MFREEITGIGAVRKTLIKYLNGWKLEIKLPAFLAFYRKLLSYGFGNENSPLEKRALEIDVSDLENIESFYIKIVLIDIIEFM